MKWLRELLGVGLGKRVAELERNNAMAVLAFEQLMKDVHK